MKKSILFLAIAALTFVSCEKETPEPTPTPTPTPTPVATGSYHLFFVDMAPNYAHLYLYKESTMTLVENDVILSYPNDLSYPGSVYMYNDTTYVLEVEYGNGTTFYQGTVVGGNTLTHTDVDGSLQWFTPGGVGKWKVMP